jgi:hypothetical protein
MNIEEEIRKMEKALSLLKLLSQSERDKTDGKFSTQEEFFAEMDRDLQIED